MTRTEPWKIDAWGWRYDGWVYASVRDDGQLDLWDFTFARTRKGAKTELIDCWGDSREVERGIRKGEIKAVKVRLEVSDE